MWFAGRAQNLNAAGCESSNTASFSGSRPIWFVLVCQHKDMLYLIGRPASNAPIFLFWLETGSLSASWWRNGPVCAIILVALMVPLNNKQPVAPGTLRAADQPIAQCIWAS
jgi:hypothetical protein